MERQLIDWLVRYGSPLLFVAQVFGIFGLPIPDELLLTVAGVLVRRGQLAAAPTILSARAGFPVSEIFGEGWAYTTSYLQSNAEAARVFLINGRPPKIGELFRNPSLADTLAELVAQAVAGVLTGFLPQHAR